MTVTSSAAGRPDWVPDAVFYQIFPDRFANGSPALDRPGTVPWDTPPDREHFHGGDLAGITSRLGHLARLGVSGLYLNPVFTAGTNHRYDTHDYFAVDPRLGDLGALRELVGEAHRLGIRVLLDGVFNHCGDGHEAFRDWRARGAQSPYAGWFIGWDPQRTGGLDYQTCGGAAYLPKLRLEDASARDHILRVATYWIEQAGIDGWRLDVPFKVAHEFWQLFREAVRAVDPNAYLLGEVWRDAVPWIDVFDGTINYRQRANILGYCLDDTLDAEDFGQETAELSAAHGEAANWMVNLVGSHDTARILTLAHGDRNRTLCAIAAMFTLPGVPLLYYGDEVGLAGGDDPGCRKAMQWDEAMWDPTILDAVVALSTARRQSPALRRGGFTARLVRNGLIAFERATMGADADAICNDRVVVVLNPRAEQTGVVIPLGRGLSSRCWRNVMSGGTVTSTERGLVLDTVAACSFTILRQEPSEANDP
ncbi:glycoside hydrolase family 13 protein [soil metagenome]